MDKHVDNSYDTPKIEDYGSIGELTQQTQNKVGKANDAFTALTGGVVVGSLKPSP